MAEGKKFSPVATAFWILFKLKRKNYWDLFKWIDKNSSKKYAYFFFVLYINLIYYLLNNKKLSS
jgi:hypothetical protein